MEDPRHEMTSEQGVDAGMVRLQGDVFTHLGWPSGKGVSGRLKPVNAAAERVTKYVSRAALSPFLPASPYRNDLGGIFLPAQIVIGQPSTAPGA